mgnify:CR=1 FL=1
MAPITTPLGEMFMFTIEGGELSLAERRTLLDWTIRPALRTVQGVADVNALGGIVTTFEIRPNAAALAGVGLTFSDLREAAARNDSEITATPQGATKSVTGKLAVIDNAITRTMSRTIITHGCTQLMVTSMLFFGGETLHYFALALTIGICFGIYSSVLVASPIVMWLRVSREDLVKPEKKAETIGASF